jgi:hypothetical protein
MPPYPHYDRCRRPEGRPAAAFYSQYSRKPAIDAGRKRAIRGGDLLASGFSKIAGAERVPWQGFSCDGGLWRPHTGGHLSAIILKHINSPAQDTTTSLANQSRTGNLRAGKYPFCAWCEYNRGNAGSMQKIRDQKIIMLGTYKCRKSNN